VKPLWLSAFANLTGVGLAKVFLVLHFRIMKRKTDKKETQFDAIKTMREIRDQLSKEIMLMSFAEEKEYLKKLLAKKSNVGSAKVFLVLHLI